MEVECAISSVWSGPFDAADRSHKAISSESRHRIPHLDVMSGIQSSRFRSIGTRRFATKIGSLRSGDTSLSKACQERGEEEQKLTGHYRIANSAGAE